MNTFRLGKQSREKLKGVHPDLILIVGRAIQITEIDFGVSEGLRSKKRQAELVRRGASKTMRSKHLTGDAVDLVAYIGKDVRWDWPLYAKISTAMKQAAKELRIPIEWGGDWRTFKDGPHFQRKV